MIRTRTEIEITQEDRAANVEFEDRYYDLAMEYIPFSVIDPPEVQILHVNDLNGYMRDEDECGYLAMNSQTYLEWRADQGVDLELEHIETTLDHVVGGYRHLNGRLTTIIACPDIPVEVILGQSATANLLIIHYIPPRLMNA